MSSSSSSSSSSGSETEEIFNVEGVELSSIVPYEGDLEPLATAEEAAEQEARMAEELEEERRFQARFTREVDASTWCTCSNCSVQFTTKPEECQCCNEIDRCGEVMERFGDSHQCITLHPWFQDVCLNRHVLEVAALGLKTKSGKSYRTLFDQGRRPEAEFFRSVAYRQFTRLLWDFTGRARRYPLPCCSYTKIRKQFPDENGQYHGFEDDDEMT
ncbi:P2X purinoceptor 7-like [Acropora muricata]|uniref:P2X purinoceptor 7-like n=1 Tax=Acropora muricata TaxID=159855 RepID=UPI0034E4118F